MKLLKRLILALGILVGVVNIGMGAMSNDEWNRARQNCQNEDKSACQALINNGLVSVEQCDKDSCGFVGAVYYQAGRYSEVIPYFEKVIVFGDNRVYTPLGYTYYELQDYYNAKKYFEIGCNKGELVSCYNLGLRYYNGEGVRQDYAKARELWKKACDMKYGAACNNLAVLYDNGLGVRQNLSTAKHYFGKACDLGDQLGCDNYKKINQVGY